MPMRHLFISLWTALLGLTVLGGCASVPTLLEKPKVSIEHFDIESLDSKEAHFLLRLKITNPNDVSITLNSLKAELTMANQHIAIGHSEAPVSLASRRDTEVRLEVVARSEALRALAQDMLFNPNKKVPYHLHGEAEFTDLKLKRDFDRDGAESLLTWFSHKNPSSSPDALR